MSAFWSSVLSAVQLFNRITVTAVLITAFSLLIYIALYNRRSEIGRAYAIVLACVIGTALGDLLAQISDVGSDEPWLRLQWVGIAFIPAASLHMSDVLLRATADTSPLRRLAPRVGAGIGLVVFLLVLFTDFVATPGLSREGLTHLVPGVLFYPFTLYYFASVGWASYNVFEARRRALTSTSKRRMTYLAFALPVPALSMFLIYSLRDGLDAAAPCALGGHFVGQHGIGGRDHIDGVHSGIFRRDCTRSRDQAPHGEVSHPRSLARGDGDHRARAQHAH